MIDLKTIKLVIWDLDETFWKGTLSEGGVQLPDENAKLVRDLTDCGIINSICSKNDFEPTKKHLQDLGLWEFFVFPTINWEGKGPQIKDKIDKMGLRPVNVLFLDDNFSNLGEAKHFLPELQVGGPDCIKELIKQVADFEKKDTQHNRLKQYRVLEAKDTASKAYASSEDFLYNSLIQVEIQHDCLNHIHRIHELLMRSNQLNYTKKRIGIDELSDILKSPQFDCGYVTVKDRFGDYGIVGFYAMTSGRLEHFIFSCRTMGQKIEQWVYAKLGFPMLEVIGEVRTQLNSYECPGWINNKNDNKDDSKSIVDYEKRDNNCSVLLKGPCDLSHSQMYIKNKGFFDAEFTYVSNSNGQIIDAFNHSVHIEGLHSYTEEEKKQIVEDCIFVDPNMLDGSFFTKKYDVIFLSTLIESNYYIYRKKGTNIRVVFGGYDLTNCDNWDNYCNGTYYNGGNSFSIDYLKGFSERYECVGRTTPKMYIEFLSKCLEWLPKETTLCLILGATKTFGVEFGYEDKQRIDRQKRLNEAIIKMSLMQPRIKCVEIDKCLCDKSDLTDDICHFSTRTYYEIAQEMVRIIALATGKQMQTYSTKIIQIDGLILKIRTVIKKVVSPQGWLYGKMKYIYTRIYKNRK